MTPSSSVVEKLPASTAERSACTAAACSVSNSVTRWCGSGSGGRLSGMTISTRLPEATSPSTTPEEHSAASASAALARMAPSAAISSARLRAGVMRGGSGAPSTTVTPNRGFVGSNTARALIIMRTVMPSGASVYLAIHSAKRSVSAGSGGTSRRAVMAFSFLGSTGFPARPRPTDRFVPDDADAALRAERHQHEASRLQLDALGHDVIVRLVERDGEHDRRQLCAGACLRLQRLEQTVHRRQRPQAARIRKANGEPRRMAGRPQGMDAAASALPAH